MPQIRLHSGGDSTVTPARVRVVDLTPRGRVARRWFASSTGKSLHRQRFQVAHRKRGRGAALIQRCFLRDYIFRRYFRSRRLDSLPAQFRRDRWRNA